MILIELRITSSLKIEISSLKVDISSLRGIFNYSFVQGFN